MNISHKTDNNIILNKLNDIMVRLDTIEKRLDTIEKHIEYLTKGNDNMLNHISFIENVYDTIKSPFYFILNKIKPIENLPIKQSLPLPSPQL